MLRAMRRELETKLRSLLPGHEGGTPETAKESPTDCRASSRPYHFITTTVWSRELRERAGWAAWLFAHDRTIQLRTKTAYGSSLNGLKTLSPGRLKSRSFPVAIVSPCRRAVAAL